IQMITNSQTHNGNGFQKSNESKPFEIKEIILKYLNNWYWFVLSVVLILAVAFIYVRYTRPLYQISSTILMGEANSNSPFSAIYGQVPGAQERIDLANLSNHIAIMTSSPIISRTLSGLDYEL